VVGLTVVLQRALGSRCGWRCCMVVGFTFTYILLGGASTHIRTNAMQAGS
jgi:hypothetical protein